LAGLTPVPLLKEIGSRLSLSDIFSHSPWDKGFRDEVINV